MKRIMTVLTALSLALCGGCANEATQRSEPFIKAGDDYAVSVKKILAAGGKQTDYPDHASIGPPPRPVVDVHGHTNWVSDAVDPYANRRVFLMKDGRIVTVTIKGTTVLTVHTTSSVKTD
jgi:hypothetical protein